MTRDEIVARKKAFEPILETYLRDIGAIPEGSFLEDFVLVASHRYIEMMDSNQIDYTVSPRAGQPTHITVGLLHISQDYNLKRRK